MMFCGLFLAIVLPLTSASPPATTDGRFAPLFEHEFPAQSLAWRGYQVPLHEVCTETEGRGDCLDFVRKHEQTSPADDSLIDGLCPIASSVGPVYRQGLHSHWPATLQLQGVRLQV